MHREPRAFTSQNYYPLLIQVRSATAYYEEAATWNPEFGVSQLCYSMDSQMRRHA